MKTFYKSAKSVDFNSDISLGLIKGRKIINKFGHSPNGIQVTSTDVWDRADATPTQQIWLAPTAARIHGIVSDDATDVGAKGILTFAANVGDTESVTIGTKVYTFQTTLTDVDGNVKIGASASASIDNLIAAINLAAGAGSTYATSMSANSIDMNAVAGAGDTMDLYFDTDDLTTATTSTDANVTWGATTVVGGTGARKIQIYGLKTWDTKESSEIIWLNGTVSKNTANSYVIIHRMKVLKSGDTKINAGKITATAADDATVTATILEDEGQTQMAVYGVPSCQCALITSYYTSLVDAVANPSTANAVDIRLIVNTNPELVTTQFITKHSRGVSNAATSEMRHKFEPYNNISGPCIIKLQGIAYLADTELSGGFDIILADK